LAKLAKCSRDSAHRDIQDLIKQGAIKKNAGGSRSTSYHLNL
jgi:DeoR/GlpR family transcriptional regulator of sugar metabolism